MLAKVLSDGFSHAHRHLGLVVVDVLWRLVWLGITVFGLLAVAYSFVPDVEAPSTNFSVIDAWVAASLLRQFWTENAAALLASILSVIGVAIVLYLVLEASFRRRLVVRGINRKQKTRGELIGEFGIGQTSEVSTPVKSSFVVFASSSLAKSAILGVSAVLLALAASASAYAGIAALAGFAALTFLLTIIDTLIRADAVELLGMDLLGVTGVIGILVLFESMICASLAIGVVAGFLSVSTSFHLFAMLGVTALVLVLINFLHSYLLVVRFSAVGIMSRNVISV